MLSSRRIGAIAKGKIEHFSFLYFDSKTNESLKFEEKHILKEKEQVITIYLFSFYELTLK